MQITKRIKKEIDEVADQLPTSYYEAEASCYATGQQLLAQGLTEFNGKPIEPKKQYWITEGFLFPVNHNRQLRKAYEQSGKEGIIEYLKGQNAIHRPQPLTSIRSIQL